MEIKIKELDLSEAEYSDKVTQFDLLVMDLKSDGKYKPNLLYRGFNGKYILKLLKTGQDNIQNIYFVLMSLKLEIYMVMGLAIYLATHLIIKYLLSLFLIVTY